MSLFPRESWPWIAVVHLSPLPGAPRYADGVDSILEEALGKADALVASGADAVLFENFGDAPFFADRVPPVVPAILAVLVAEARRRHSVPFGLNCLRNDGESALGAAVASGAAFIRVNVLVGAVASDQGLIEGSGAALLRARKAMASKVEIWADLRVKHATPLFCPSLEDEAHSAVDRGLADALIVTGARTGSPPDLSDLSELRARFRSATPILVGSGMSPENLAGFVGASDGAIVGSSLLVHGRAGASLDPERTRQFSAALARARGSRMPPRPPAPSPPPSSRP